MTTGGRWSVDLAVARPGLPVSVQRYAWVVADPTAPHRRTIASDRPLAPILNRAAGGVAGFAVVVGLVVGWRQTRGSRRRTKAPPSGASSTQTEPLNVAATAATRASPSPVPGSSPAGVAVKEPLEHALAVIDHDAGAVVGDLDRDRGRRCLASDPDGAAGLGEPDGVLNHGVDRLLQPQLVDHSVSADPPAADPVARRGCRTSDERRRRPWRLRRPAGRHRGPMCAGPR